MRGRSAAPVTGSSTATGLRKRRFSKGFELVGEFFEGFAAVEVLLEEVNYVLVPGLELE